MAATGGGMRRIPFKIAAIYGVLAALWILFTDAFVAASVPSPELQHTLSTLKGWAFVAVTAVILYVWMRRYVLRLEEEERAVRETNDRLTAIVDTVPSGILILDTSGRFTFANEVARRVLRLTGPHIIERTFDDTAWDLRTIDGQPLPRERVPFAVVMRTGEAVFDSRFTIAPPDGTPMLLSVNAAPLRDVHGAITSVLGTVDDVTEQYEAERRIVHTNRLYSMLSQTNEAIVRIRDVDELYAEACRITVEYALAEKIHDKAEDLKLLIEQLLEAASIQAGSTRISLQQADVDELVRGIAERVTPPEGIEFRVEVEAGLPAVFIDRQRLAQAVERLLGNAFKYSPNGGSVVLSARRQDGRLLIAISDEGVGISAEELPDIFERFTQADMSTTRRFGGFGLGLYMAKRLVEAHGGDIRVESTPGHGSTFTIGLPLSDV